MDGSDRNPRGLCQEVRLPPRYPKGTFEGEPAIAAG
jgi:hypothetical protein